MKKYLAAGAAALALTVAPVASAAVVTPDAAPTTTAAAPSTAVTAASAAKVGDDAQARRGCVSPREARRVAIYMSRKRIAKVVGFDGKAFTDSGQFGSRQYRACRGFGYSPDYLYVSYNRKTAYGFDAPVAVNP